MRFSETVIGGNTHRKLEQDLSLRECSNDPVLREGSRDPSGTAA